MYALDISRIRQAWHTHAPRENLANDERNSIIGPRVPRYRNSANNKVCSIMEGQQLHRDSFVMGKISWYARIRAPGFSSNERATRLRARRSRLEESSGCSLPDRGNLPRAGSEIRLTEPPYGFSDSSHLLSTRPPRSLPTVSVTYIR